MYIYIDKPQQFWGSEVDVLCPSFRRMSTHITREILKAASLAEQIEVGADDDDEELGGNPSGGFCVEGWWFGMMNRVWDVFCWGTWGSMIFWANIIGYDNWLWKWSLGGLFFRNHCLSQFGCFHFVGQEIWILGELWVFEGGRRSVTWGCRTAAVNYG